MNYNETVASQARYGDVLGKIIGDWDILWEDSEADYSGHVSILAKHKNDFSYYSKDVYEYMFYEYSYGSCSGCDSWESDEYSTRKIENEMRSTALWFDNQEELRTWLTMLEETLPTIKWIDDIRKMNERIAAIKKEFENE